MRTNYELGPIFRAALRNKTGAILIALQIAVTMTVVVNSAYMVGERLGLVDRPSGLAEAEIFHLQSVAFDESQNGQVRMLEDLELLRSTAGVVDAVAVNAIPLSGSGWSSGLRVEPGVDDQSFSTAMYMVDDHGINTFGVELIAGRNFAAADVRWRAANSSDWPDIVVLSSALARSMFPDSAPADVVGRTVYISNDQPMQVVGVVERLQAPWNQWDNVEHSVMVPQRLGGQRARYMVRTEPGERDRMMPVVEQRLAEHNSERIVRGVEHMGETRERSYALDQGLARLLVVVMVALVLITAVGVLGLASFSVRRRTRQIGTRRALGASRGDILRYFLIENAFITGTGVLLGAVMTVGLNVLLVDALGFPRIQWSGVPLGMLGLLVVGQLAVLGPARRACAIAPSIATRTV